MGGKSKASALNSKAEAAGLGNGAVPQGQSGVAPCCTHWVGIKVVDEDGTPVTDVRVHMRLTDGTDAIAKMEELVLQADKSYHTKKILPAGQCKFGLPDIQDIEWWEQGGAAPNLPANESEKIDGGQCASSVATDYGYRNYLSLWKNPGNNPLPTQRPNPNMLEKGDHLHFPDKKGRDVSKAVDQVWTLVVKKVRPISLRIVLFDLKGNKLNGLAWKMTSPVAKNGTTGADGLIEIKEFPPTETSGVLDVTMPAKPKAGKVADPAPAPMAYPAPVIYSQFHDTVPPEPHGILEATWELEIGSLSTFDSQEGVQGRLGNIGFRCKPGSGQNATARAVKAYQRFYNNQRNGSGIAKDIEASIRGLHDNP